MESFNFGRAFSRIFSLIRDSLASVAPFAFILTMVGNGLNWLLQQQMLSDIQAIKPGAPWEIFASAWYWAAVVLSLAVGSINSAGSIFGFLELAKGRSPSLSDCFAAGGAAFIQVFLATLLWALGVGLGWILIVVPGVMLMTIWSVVLPALVNENAGVFGSFSRSRELTRGSRWSIFGMLLVALVVMYVPAVLFGGAVGMGALTSMSEQGLAGAFGIGTLVVGVIYGFAVTLFINALLVSLYTELRLIKEGGETEGLTEVFT